MAGPLLLRASGPAKTAAAPGKAKEPSCLSPKTARGSLAVAHYVLTTTHKQQLPSTSIENLQLSKAWLLLLPF